MANDFTNDPNCIALWRVESGALGVDSIGAGVNDLGNTGVVANTVDFREGAACVEYDGTAHFLYQTEVNLAADFPLGPGDTDKTISFCFRVKFHNAVKTTGLFHREYGGSHAWGFGFKAAYSAPNLNFQMTIGYNDGWDREFITLTSLNIQADRWYHVGVTFRDADGAYRIRVWDETAATIYEMTGNATNRLSIKGGIYLGISAISILTVLDGLLDEIVVFGDILTVGEIDQVREQTYVYTLPSKATDPSPADGATDVSATADCSWTTGDHTETFDVWWGTSPTSLTKVSAAQAGTTYDPGALSDYTTYYWRVDSTNPYGTTTGDLWTFRTAAVPAIAPSGRPVRLPKRLVLPDPRNIKTFTNEECRFYNGVEEGIQRLLQILRDALSPGRNWVFENTVLTGNTSIDGSLGIVGDVRVDGKVSFYDGNTYITVDGAGNMTFTDAIVGTHTLKQLGCPTYKRIKATAQAEGDLHLSDATTWNVSKALISCVRVLTVSTNWSLWLLQNDNGYAADDAVVPKLRIARALSGNAALMLNYPYQDEDASGEVHLYYEDTAGADTADIHVLGLEML